MAEGPFPQLVFSGGGLRCFWQGGFMHVVRDALGIAPHRIAGVSGGAMAGAGFIARVGRRLLDRMCAAFDREDWNVTLSDIDDTHGRTPHQRVYDEVVGEVIDTSAENAVAEGPSYQVLLGHPPTDRAAAFTGTAMTAVYEAELHIVNSPHFNWAETVGMSTSFVDANQAAREGRLAELVTAAATIPPVFRTPEWDGRAVIDGGIADQAPMPEPDEGETLVLLTRRYRNLPDDKPNRLYVWPSNETPADKIDFTDPEKLRRTWDLGERDGRHFIELWNGKGKEISWDV